MDLIIVESPSKAKTISKYLKGKYKVTRPRGTSATCPYIPGVDVKNNFEPKYVNSEGKEDIIRRLTDETKKAGKVYLATDPDREGEAISWHLQNVLGLTRTGKTASIQRSFGEGDRKGAPAPPQDRLQSRGRPAGAPRARPPGGI